jgi:hypothetical protein
VSRAFAPKEGLPEDPACGSAHLALQLSPRGGELYCPLQDGEVRLPGRRALYMEGSINI